MKTQTPIAVSACSNPNSERKIQEIRQWRAFAREHARMTDEQLFVKALSALAFCLRRGLRALAIPSKLKGTSRHQDTLEALAELEMPFGTLLFTDLEEGRAGVFFGESLLGYVQPKHDWLQPLLGYGARVCIIRVTGTDRPEWTLGCNVFFTGIGPAIEAYHLNGRCNGETGRNGAANHNSSDGGATAGDIRLWRDPDGTARANIPPVDKHSSTGLEWGYGGSGPADLAFSILCQFTHRTEAQRLYQYFKRDVVATIPHKGGRLEAAFVKRWLRQRRRS